MHIRDETEQDWPNIARVVEQAFGQPDEMRLVQRLRSDGDAIISLVATNAGTVVGHVMLSRMSAPFPALGLAPLSVAPHFQKQDIGTALTNAAIARARDAGWSAIFVLGDPAYYGRFGFRADLGAGFSSPHAGPHFMALPLRDALPVETGRVDYARAFDGLA